MGQALQLGHSGVALKDKSDTAENCGLTGTQHG
jgi:hypothetical protein